MHPDSKKTLIGKCVISNKTIKKISVLPTLVNQQSQPEILSSNDERFDEVVKYVEKITRDQNLDTQFITDGDEVIIHQQ
jgi:hypothetical protein